MRSRETNMPSSRFRLGVLVAVAFVPVAVAAPASTHAVQDPAAAADVTHRAGTTTIRFSNIPVRSALQLIAEEGHFNLVVSDSVQGTVSLHLVDVTWEQALDIVLRLKGLRMRIDGNTRSVSAAGEQPVP
jgi:type IV pilus assembly protein PilQ